MIEIASKVKTIFLSGGGTGGSVTPLLAVAEELLKPGSGSYRLVFVGTKEGPERDMVANFNIETGKLEFKIILGGKLRRYFSWHNIQDFFKILIAFWQAILLVFSEKPDLIISAGSFASVPLVWAAALKRVPILVHQQDVRPGLANKLMANFASVITVALEKSLLDYGPRAVFIGNPMRPVDVENRQLIKEILKEKYNLIDNLPLVLMTGGRLGAQSLNKLIIESCSALSDFQVVHLFGRGKLSELSNSIKFPLNISSFTDYPNYHPLEFLSNKELLELMSAADLVVSRCGLGVLTELSFLAKAAILIPLPDSHQEDNALAFKQADAAIVLEQKNLSPKKLMAEIKRILTDKKLKLNLENNISKVIKRGAAEKMVDIIEEILSGHK